MCPLTVVIPAYNAQAHVREAVNSALAQGDVVAGVVIVDDGSTDETASAAEIADPRVTVLRRPNGGPAAARNTGLQAVRTEWLAFLDADDSLRPGWGQAVLQELQAGNAIAVTDAEVVDENGAVLGRYYEGISVPAPPDQAHRILLENFVISTAAAATGLVRGVGGFNESRDLIGVEDWDLWQRMILAGATVALVPEVMSSYRRTGTSVSSDVRRMKQAELVLLIRERRDVPPDLRRARRAGIARTRALIRMTDIDRAIVGAPRRAGWRFLRSARALGTPWYARVGLALLVWPSLGRRLLGPGA